MKIQQGTTEAWIRHWQAGVRWRRRVDAHLAPRGLTLPRWLVLDRVGAIHRETGNPVSQKQVALRLDMAEGAISRLMDALASTGLVDRAPSSGPEYRIYLSEKGVSAVAAGRAVLDAVSTWMNAERDAHVNPDQPAG